MRSSTFTIANVVVAIAAVSRAVSATQELGRESFKDLTTSGRNGMIKFYQPWCGHCTRMKPEWDKLAEEAHPSVFIADVNCSDEDELCTENGVSGYPTIKVWREGKVEEYSGGRGFDELLGFVNTELATKCDLSNMKETCSERAQSYSAKWKDKSIGTIEKEINRLTGMRGNPMSKDLRNWLRERLTILRQLNSEEVADEL